MGDGGKRTRRLVWALTNLDIARRCSTAITWAYYTGTYFD